MARGLKFRIYIVEGLYYQCSENKGADQLHGDVRLCFAYSKRRFSHDAAHYTVSGYAEVHRKIFISVVSHNI